MNYCKRCDLNFTSRTAFDKHLPGIVDAPVQPDHRHPADCGLVYKDSGWGFPATDIQFFHKESVMETTLIRKCTETGKPFVAWGRGRPPTKRGQGRAVDVEVAPACIGKWMDRDGNVYNERPDAEPAKPAKPATKPASAKAVKATMPTPPRTAAAVPPPPPAVVDGKTAVQALADGDLHPDTFAEPPFAEDSFDSLYPDPAEAGVVEPEVDDYMLDRIAAGSLQGSF